ncbi:MAG TPA: SpoIIE family protein phosphatase [Microthrixaceae bacterium]|nr:SpoIIE family protein phosphatase [Microthrixaceae bacterium]
MQSSPSSITVREDDPMAMAQTGPSRLGAPPTRRVLLVEDDPADVLLLKDHLSQHGPELTLTVATGLDDAIEAVRTSDLDCCVLDLGLPGVDGLEALTAIRDAAPDISIVVLTGWGDVSAATRAVATGAQDYLVKGEEGGATIARSIRYAIERKRAELTAAQLAVAASREREQRRLERNLVSPPILRDPSARWDRRYVIARDGVIGGDFTDCVELADGTIRIVIGDVAGHGIEEAALGVAVRIAWRTLAMSSDAAKDILPLLESVLVAERVEGSEFATVCDLTIDPSRASVLVRSAGHPPPYLTGRGFIRDRRSGPPLGVGIRHREWPGTVHELGSGAAITVYTDGLHEVRLADGSIGEHTLLESVFAGADATSSPVDAMIETVAGMAMDGWRDDVAVGRLTISP